MMGIKQMHQEFCHPTRVSAAERCITQYTHEFRKTSHSESLPTRNSPIPGSTPRETTHCSHHHTRIPRTHEQKAKQPPRSSRFILLSQEIPSLFRDVAAWIGVGRSSITSIVVGRAIAVAMTNQFVFSCKLRWIYLLVVVATICMITIC